MNKIRLQKIIADSGYCSRRKAEAYIESGQVRVNGRGVKIGDKADPERDIVTICGNRIGAVKTSLRYIKMYKPRGVLCSMSDPNAGSKPLITDLCEDIPERVYPVGRLDAGSEGLILLTNDGEFANRVAHPRNSVKKTYRVTVKERVGEEQAATLSAGVEIDIDGKKSRTLPCQVEILIAEKERSVLIITISEGKNRQIRRMCESAGLTVSRLKRISIGKVKLGMLKPGEFTDLTDQELRSLNGSHQKSSQ